MRAIRPVLSVVVPTKGRPRYLKGCLSALARTDYPRELFEVVVVNDAGGPEVERVVASKAGAMPVLLVSPEGSGPSAARNAGAFAARGRYVAFTDDDCEPAPGWLAALQRALEQNPGAAVGGVTRNGAPQNTAAVATQLVVDAVHAHFNRDPAAPRFFASYNVAFPAEPFRALGGFDERFRYAEDRELCERWVATGHRFVHAPDALVLHIRRLTLREFWGQHYGYGRGAWAFRGARAAAGTRESDPIGIQRALLGELLHSEAPAGRLSLAAHLGLSQAATGTGFLRESIAARSRR